MFKNIFKIFLGVILSITLCFNLGIRQYLHSFEHHEDTIHTCGLDDENHYNHIFIDNLHHHCDYVSDLLPAFIATTLQFEFVSLQDFNFTPYQIENYSIIKRDAFFQFFLRGPPIAPLA